MKCVYVWDVNNDIVYVTYDITLNITVKINNKTMRPRGNSCMQICSENCIY